MNSEYQELLEDYEKGEISFEEFSQKAKSVSIYLGKS